MQNLIVGVVGRRGSGKSTIVKPMLQRCPRLFMWDAMGEHDWIPNRFATLDELPPFLNWSQQQPQFAGAYIPQDDDLAAEFGPVCSVLYQRGNLVFGVEEVPMLCSPGFLPPAFDRIIRLGRHKRLSVVWTAQRMNEVARRLTAATDVFVIFSHTEPVDLEAITYRCGQETAARVAQLGHHDHLIWTVASTGQVGSADQIRFPL